MGRRTTTTRATTARPALIPFTGQAAGERREQIRRDHELADLRQLPGRVTRDEREGCDVRQRRVGLGALALDLRRWSRSIRAERQSTLPVPGPSDPLHLPWGARITVGVAAQRLRLVV